MRRIIILSLMGLSFLILPATAWSDTLTLLDGTTISGVVMSRTATRVTFRDDQGVSRRYSTGQIQSLQLSRTGRTIRYDRTVGIPVTMRTTTTPTTETTITLRAATTSQSTFQQELGLRF
jgi:hypothetical protein